MHFQMTSFKVMKPIVSNYHSIWKKISLKFQKPIYHTKSGIVIISDDFSIINYKDISFNAFCTKPIVHKVFYSIILSKNLFQNLMIFTPPMAPDNWIEWYYPVGFWNIFPERNILLFCHSVHIISHCFPDFSVTQSILNLKLKRFIK